MSFQTRKQNYTSSQSITSNSIILAEYFSKQGQLSVISFDRTLIATIDGYGNLRTKIPTLITFRINHDRRSETMRHYFRPYRFLSYPSQESEPALHQYYFNPKVDTVQFSSADFLYLHYHRVFTPQDKYWGYMGENLSRVSLVEFGAGPDRKLSQEGLNVQGNFDYTHTSFIHWPAFLNLEELTICLGRRGLRHQRAVDNLLQDIRSKFLPLLKPMVDMALHPRYHDSTSDSVTVIDWCPDRLSQK